ncbi:MAG: DNA-binding protein [Kytococcus sp.]|nr:DNA-binding protein [Kytococcus sp.]
MADVNETTSTDTWLTLPDLAEQLGVRISEVRRWLDERQLVAVRRGERKVLSVPAAFIGEDGPLPELAGTFTVLADGRFSDDEIVEWMFAHDETLPGGTTPIEAIRAGFKTEVRRRAMEEAL